MSNIEQGMLKYEQSGNELLTSIFGVPCSLFVIHFFYSGSSGLGAYCTDIDKKLSIFLIFQNYYFIT